MRKLRFIVLFLTSLCLMMSGITVSAADDRLGTVVDGSVLTDKTEAVIDTRMNTRGKYLSYGTGTIALKGNRSVMVSGTTICSSICDKVKVAVFLERLVDGKWVNVETLTTKTATNACSVSNSKTYTVKGGYYYRMTGLHIAVEGDVTESTASSTDGLWVD